MKQFKKIAIASLMLISVTSFASCENLKKGSDQNSEIKSLVDNYFTSLENGDYKVYASFYPDFYMDMYEDFAEGYGYKSADAYFLNTEYGYYISTVGDNFTIDATINSINKMKSDELETGEIAIRQTYNIDSIDLKSGYIIDITEKASGPKGSDAETYEIMVLEINNELYIYNQYFEYLATME